MLLISRKPVLTINHITKQYYLTRKTLAYPYFFRATFFHLAPLHFLLFLRNALSLLLQYVRENHCRSVSFTENYMNCFRDGSDTYLITKMSIFYDHNRKSWMVEICKLQMQQAQYYFIIVSYCIVFFLFIYLFYFTFGS